MLHELIGAIEWQGAVLCVGVAFAFALPVTVLVVQRTTRLRLRNNYEIERQKVDRGLITSHRRE